MKATLKAHGKEWQVTLKIGRYRNGNLAIEVIDHSEGYPVDFATMTVNLGNLSMPDAAYVDTNNCKWAEEFIADTGIAVPSGIMKKSGYCEYPLYYFDVDTIDDKYSDPDDEVRIEKRTWTDPNGFVCEQIRFLPLQPWDKNDGGWRTTKVLYATKS